MKKNLQRSTDNDQLQVEKNLCEDVLLDVLVFNNVSFFVFFELLLREIDIRPCHCLADAKLPAREY